MREAGVRVKFRAVALTSRPRRIARMASLARWCRIFDREGLAPVEGGASAGNLSFRTPRGFVITATRTLLKSRIPWHGFAEVVDADWDRFEIRYRGGAPPSSDSFLHERIYAARPDVGAVFHGHDALVLRHGRRLARERDVVFTPRRRLFGTRADARETAAALGRHVAVIRRGHGFVTVGRTPAEAGRRALALHRSALRLESLRRDGACSDAARS
jgi:ribulose-5-phosphate 4-epimerase/fuculose-1-phosphate aldolase